MADCNQCCVEVALPKLLWDLLFYIHNSLCSGQKSTSFSQKYKCQTSWKRMSINYYADFIHPVSLDADVWRWPQLFTRKNPDAKTTAVSPSLVGKVHLYSEDPMHLVKQLQCTVLDSYNICAARAVIPRLYKHCATRHMSFRARSHIHETPSCVRFLLVWVQFNESCF